MAVPKLNLPEVRRRFLQVLTQTGRDGVACRAIGIDEATLYRHVKRDTEFASARIRAREEFHRHDDTALVACFRAAVIRLCQEGYEEEWTTIQTETLPDGRVIERRSVKRCRKPMPEWLGRLVAPMSAGKPMGTNLDRLEISGPNGGPVQYEHDFRESEDGELIREAYAILQEAAPPGQA